MFKLPLSGFYQDSVAGSVKYWIKVTCKYPVKCSG